jgi:vancomycin resistance protein YoaR
MKLRWPRGLAAGIGTAVALGAIAGVWALPRASTEAPVPLALSLYGRTLPSDESAFETALAQIRERWSGWVTLELPDGGTRTVGYGALGVELDRGRLRQLISDAADNTSPWSRRVQEQEHGAVATLALPVPLRLDAARAGKTLAALKDELDRPPVDARIDVGAGKLQSEREGILLDVDASLNAIRRALESGDERAALLFARREPRRRMRELEHVGHTVVLGFFETNYDRAERAAARTFNLELAASKLDGYVLFPGETLDFNAVVGPRDEANGYQVAPVIAQGEVVDGIGGGTCQISGTLHAAALFSGLRIDERYPHTRPSAYIKLGLDAAVVYPAINLRLSNPYDFPVVAHVTVADGVVRAEFRGAQRPRTVTLIRRIDGAVPFEQLEREDESLPRGQRAIVQRGVPGLKLHRYRILRDGNHALRERINDTYPPTSQIVRVGVGPASAEGSAAARAEAPPEYVADELLVMTQQPDATPPLVVSQTPGRFGRVGWTREWAASPATLRN